MEEGLNIAAHRLIKYNRKVMLLKYTNFTNNEAAGSSRVIQNLFFIYCSLLYLIAVVKYLHVCKIFSCLDPYTLRSILMCKPEKAASSLL